MPAEPSAGPQPPVAPPLPVAHPAPAAPSPRKPRIWLAVIAAGILGGILGAAAMAALGLAFVLPVKSTITQVESSSPSSTVTIETANEEATFAEAVATKMTPSVVSVSIEQVGFDPFSGTTVTQTVGNGSGVIIRQDGYILTNNHVVADADKLVVTIGVDDLPATVVGTDPSTDLAVIKVDRTGLPAAEMGVSSALKVGQPVVAIGSPFGLEKSVTSGIVSALGRSSLSEGSSGLTAYTSLIQTDAAINPGNSGGALCDAEGRLIGINTLIQTTSGSSAGVGFAIPIDFAKSIADELISTGKATHPFLGVSSATIDSASAQRFGLSVDRGVLVQNVVSGSPAEAAGIKQGDIIVRIDGEDIASVEDMFAAIRSQKVGDTVDVEIVRADQHSTLRATLASDAQRQ
ncbi:MAG: trypsin-like peptidase domain-containing protein, partial [Coriobacteriia bacterium]